MDVHPVPKNVLTVDFKLFGALTAKQFLKVLLACMLGLALALSHLPKLVGIPLSIIVVIVGVMSALVQDFAVRFSGLMRAIFVSPRYVWQKSSKTPDVLSKAEEKVKAKHEVKKMAAAGPDLTDISIEKLLDARTAAAESDVANIVSPDRSQRDQQDIEGDPNFARVYSDIYQQPQPVPNPMVTTPGIASGTGGADAVPVGPNSQVRINPMNNSGPRDSLQTQAAQAPVSMTDEEKQTLLNQYKQQVQELNAQLAGASGEDRQKIAEHINQIYELMQQVAGGSVSVPKPHPAASAKLLYGVAVDKAGAPVPGTIVSLFTKEGAVLVSNIDVGADGRFALPITNIPDGEYVVRLVHPGQNFPDFGINIGDEQLPGYKFRAQ
jgi:hypothetical protein